MSPSATASGGVRAEAQSVECDHEVGCITCGDTATELRVLRFDADRELALCEDADGAHSSVETALVGAVAEGQWLLVHAGTALNRVDPPPEQV